MTAMNTKDWAKQEGWQVAPSWQEGFFEVHDRLGNAAVRRGYESAQQFASERAAWCKIASIRHKQEQARLQSQNRPIYVGD